MALCYVFAMKAETEPFLSAVHIENERSFGYAHVYEFTHQGQKGFVCISGIGKVLAGAAVASCLAAYSDIDAVVNLGIGGSLDSERAPLMSAVVGERYVQHDVDTTAFGDPSGYLSTPDLVFIPGEPKLIQRIMDASKSLGVPCCKGTMATGDQFIAKMEDKGMIARRFDALIVDMEAACYAEVCHGFGVPFAALRVVSDADGDQEEYLRNKFPAGERVCKIGLELMK